MYYNSDNKLFFIQTIIYSLFLINVTNVIVIPQRIILLLILLSVCFLSESEITAYIVGFSMMGTGVQIAYVSLMCLLVLIIKRKGILKKQQIFLICCFLLSEFFHVFFTSYDSLTEFFRYSSVYCLLIILLSLNRNSSERKLIVDSYIYSTCFTICNVFFEMYYLFDGKLSKFIDGSIRFGYAEQVGHKLLFSADPNLLGQSCSFIIVLSICLIMLGYNEKKYYIGIIIGGIAGTLTISKTFLLSVICIGILIILFSGSINNKKSIINKISFIAVGLLLIIIIKEVNPDYIDNILSRVDNTDITTGRVDNALIYINYLINNINHLFFGVGMQNVGMKIGFSGSPHAAIIEMIICWGVFGTVVALWYFIFSLNLNVLQFNKKKINYIPLILFLLITQTTQLFRLRDRVFSILVFIAFVGINSRVWKGEPNEEEKSLNGNKF